MQLLLDSTKLEAILQRKQEDIGYKKLDQSCNVANALFVMYGGFLPRLKLPCGQK